MPLLYYLIYIFKLYHRVKATKGNPKSSSLHLLCIDLLQYKVSIFEPEIRFYGVVT